MERLQVLNLQNREDLLSHTPYVLPRNPSDKKWTADQIRKKMYEGYLYLFDTINTIISALNLNVIDVVTDFMDTNTAIADAPEVTVPNWEEYSFSGG